MTAQVARLRVRHQLSGLRVAELRFTPSKAAEFLNQAMGLTLSASEVAASDSRTEGWIAGLQLAAPSMKGKRDVTEFIQALTGDHRYIVDHLVEPCGIWSRPLSFRLAGEPAVGCFIEPAQKSTPRDCAK